MAEVNSTPISIKCKVCGGDLRNDYLAGTCVCVHCGNKWDLLELVPEYRQYTSIVERINRATKLLEGKEDIATAGQAKTLFQNATADCLRHTDPIAADLVNICHAGVERAEQTRHYAMAMTHYDKQNYKQALSEFQKIPGIKDVDEKTEECKVQVAIQRKKRIPYAIVIGLVIPTILCIFMKEYFGLPLALDIPVALVCAAGLAYAVYLDGTLSLVVQILSFLSAVPLILFSIMAYGLHIDKGPAAALAVGIPIAFIIAVAVKPERTE